MTLEEAWREHNHAKKRFRKEITRGNARLAQEHWERAERLWRAIGMAVRA
jgi:hypothetical protein